MMSGHLIVNIAVILIVLTAWWIIYITVKNEIKMVEDQSVHLKNLSDTPALRHNQVLKKESNKPPMNIRPPVHPHIGTRWQNLGRLRKKWFFFTFAQKMGQKGLKMSWIGMVWLDMARLGSWVIKLFSICQKYQNWKSNFQEFGRNFETYYKRQFGFYFSVQTSFDHNLAIQKHTIPNQDI